MRKLVATAAAGLAIVTGSVAAAALSPIGGALAQQEAPTTTAPAPGGPGTQDGPGAPGTPGQDQGPGRPQGHRGKFMRKAITDAAGVIGVSPRELAQALGQGQSVADVATAHGVDAQLVIDKLVADASAKVDEAVAEGKIPAERAATIKDQLPERLGEMVNRHPDPAKVQARKDQIKDRIKDRTGQRGN